MPIFLTNTTKTVLPEQSLKTLIEQVIISEKKSCLEISAVYCGDRYIKKINQSYLNHSYPTDTISFRLNEGQVIEGEFYISIHTIKRNAHYYGVSFENELFRVTIHSVLHLLGYNDQTPEEKRRMTEKEDHYLNRFQHHLN